AGSATDLIAAERTRRSALAPIDRAAGQYLVRRGAGLSIIAGYPWFTDWGRDTFIALRGLLLARDRLEPAGEILAEWAGSVSEGMLPNRFPDRGETPEYNAVDASLWFVVTAAEYLARVPADAARLRPPMEAILAGYAAGTRYGIGLDGDGLLRSGAEGLALTWMDARVDGRPVTSRAGKPVEVQALWINALHAGAAWSARWADLERRAHSAFLARFPDPATGGLRDGVDPDNNQIRPNQILAVGGLPLQLLPEALARRVADLVEGHLLTPLGLRTLDRSDPAYIGHYGGGPQQRDAAYHQGTAWPWLLGPFVEAWLRVRSFNPDAKSEARSRFLAPLLSHLAEAGLGHVSELADGDPPHRPGGSPFQAWSLGEMIRIESLLE
ncbi:MAG: glycogen debranching protein, partial [Acetobacteraceae bacterium]|nr:glycogen debranching protein [Acetobacteraceae bacterium]